jgi:hypothetical protein
VLDQRLEDLRPQVRVHVGGPLQQRVRALEARLEQLDGLGLACRDVLEVPGKDAVDAPGVDRREHLLPVLDLLGGGRLGVAQAVERLLDALEVGDDGLDAGVDVGGVVERRGEEVFFFFLRGGYFEGFFVDFLRVPVRRRGGSLEWPRLFSLAPLFTGETNVSPVKRERRRRRRWKSNEVDVGKRRRRRGSLKLALSPFIPSSGDSSRTTSTRSALVPPALSAFSFLPRPLCRLDRVEKGTLVQGEARFRTRKRENARGMNAIFFPLFFEERR